MSINCLHLTFLSPLATPKTMENVEYFKRFCEESSIQLKGFLKKGVETALLAGIKSVDDADKLSR